MVLTEKRHHTAKDWYSGFDWRLIPLMIVINEANALLPFLPALSIFAISITAYSLSILNIIVLHIKLTIQ